MINNLVRLFTIKQAKFSYITFSDDLFSNFDKTCYVIAINCSTNYSLKFLLCLLLFSFEFFSLRTTPKFLYIFLSFLHRMMKMVGCGYIITSRDSKTQNNMHVLSSGWVEKQMNTGTSILMHLSW